MIHRSMESDGYESCERNRYSDDDAGSGSYGDGDDGVEDYDFNDGDASDDDVREKAYTILSEADIQLLQEEDISRLSNELYIPRAHSCILLCHYNWNSGKVHDEWFSDEGKVRNVVGLLEHPAVMPNVQELSCRICLELYRCSEMRAASCGHLFCHECWRGYIHSSINDGPGCLMLRCPSPSCAASVGQDMVNDFVSDEDKEKYSRYLRRFYIENDRKTKWCPAPGCEFAVNFDRSSSNCDVCCGCAYSFCWNCEEEGHRPVDCETVAKWIFKNSSEAENTKWILANSKPCPKCKRPIEKNQGCMHMTCNAPCRFEFCWLCLGAWSEHGEMTGGFYACNGYEKAKQEGTIYEEENRRQIAKNSLERYTHYYERWASNQSSRQKALADLQSMRTEKFEKLHENLSVPETEFGFIIEAWEQIVDCRRVLKWTYAFGYYLPESEKEKRQLFEYLQGEAESGLERLHMCAEKELKVFLSEEDPSGTSKEFSDYRRKLAGLTRVTQSYFENLVQALESGLVEVGASSMI